MVDRVSADVAPSVAGWYGLMCTDGDREVWIGTAYWDGERWDRNMRFAYVRSAQPFETEQTARDWAHAQPD